MTNLKDLIQDEYQGITFNVQASQIISAYKKERRKNVAAFTGATLCCLVILSVVAGMNPRAVHQFLNATGKMFENMLSGKINYVELTEPAPPSKPSKLNNYLAETESGKNKNETSVNKTNNNETDNANEVNIQAQTDVPYTTRSEVNLGMEEPPAPIETEAETVKEKPTEEVEKKSVNIQVKPQKPTAKVVETTQPKKPTDAVRTQPSSTTVHSQPVTDNSEEKISETTKPQNTTDKLQTQPVSTEELTDKPVIEPSESYYESTEQESSLVEETETTISTEPESSTSRDNKNPKEDVLKYELISDIEIKITGCNPVSSILIIPETIDGYTVREIGSQILSGSDNVTEVVIPDTVTVIGEKAFRNCKKLTSVKMSESIEEIGLGAFEGCKTLSSIDLKSVSKIGGEAFKNCDSLSSVKIPESAVKIGPSAFQSCDNLKTVYLNADYDYVNIFSYAYTFLNCKNLEELIVGEGVTYINSYAFKGCASLRKIEFPSTLKEIYMYAFYGCESIETLTLPEGLETIGTSAFYNCSSLNEVNLPESLKAVRSEAFYNCLNLNFVTIPKGTLSLEKLCFGYYSSDSSDVRLWNFTIQGYEQTAAWNYAFYNGFTFERIGEAPTLTVLELEKYFVMLGESESCEIKYTLEFPVGKTEFTSSDPEIASVDENGVVTANNRGTATIDVTNNNVTKQFIVIVR